MAKTPKKYLDLNGLSYYNDTYINTIVNAIDETKQDKVPEIVYTINSSSNVTCNKTFSEIMSIIQEKSANGEFLYALAQQSTGAMFATGFSITSDSIMFIAQLGTITHTDTNTISVSYNDTNDYLDYMETRISNLESSMPTDLSDLSDSNNIIPTDLSQLSDSNSIIPTDLSDLSDNQHYIPFVVSDLTNDADYVNSSSVTTMIAQAMSGTLKRLIVSTLPTSNIDTNTIYMIAKTTSLTNNAYNEFMYINNQWELIGDTDTVITVDNTITQNSNNAISSGAVYAAIGNIESALEALL